MELPSSLLTLLTTEGQRHIATPAVVAAALGDHGVTLGREGELAIRAATTIDEATDFASLDFVAVAAMRRQLVDAAHDQLQFLAMRLNTWAEQLMGDHVGDFVRHRLAQEVFLVGPVQLQVEAQIVFRQVRDTGLLPA